MPEGGLLLTREENMIPGSFFVHRNLMLSQFVEQITSGPLPINQSMMMMMNIDGEQEVGETVGAAMKDGKEEPVACCC